MRYAQFPEVTRVTVVGEQGIEFERYNLFTDGAEVHLQDAGRTLKVFPRILTPEPVSAPEMEPIEALELGWLMGALMAVPGVHAEPIMDGMDYTNRFRIQMKGPLGEDLTYVLTAGIERRGT
jgi:hypothetical protein